MKNEMQCPSCEKGKLTQASDIVSELDGHFFIQGGSRCSSCGEEFVSEKEGQKMIQAARKLGLWGEPLKLSRKLSKTKRGIIVRIPKDLENAMRLKGSEKISLSRAGRRIYIDLPPA